MAGANVAPDMRKNVREFILNLLDHNSNESNEVLCLLFVPFFFSHFMHVSFFFFFQYSDIHYISALFDALGRIPSAEKADLAELESRIERYLEREALVPCYDSAIVCAIQKVCLCINVLVGNVGFSLYFAPV